MTRFTLSAACVLLSAFILTGCAPKTPRTLDEFRLASENKSRAIAKTETFEVNRPFSKVYADIKAQGEKCLSMRIDSTQKGLLKDTKTYYVYSAVTKKTGKSSATMALIWGHEEYRNKFPDKDVWYKLTVDMKAAGRKKTSVTMNGTYFGNEPYRAIKAYAEGRTYRHCPPSFY